MYTLVALMLASTPDAGVGSTAPVLAVLERKSCFGWCASYVVTVHTDGFFEWEGRQFVITVGRRTAQLSPAQVAALTQAFEAAKYFELEGDFRCHGATDNPSARTAYTRGARTRSIEHYAGCQSTPGVEGLTALEEQFDSIVETTRWAGTSEERLQFSGRLKGENKGKIPEKTRMGSGN